MTQDTDEAQAALRTFMDDAFCTLAKQGFQELVKISGVTDAIAAVKPYKNRNAYILLCLVKKRMNLKGSGIETLATPLCLAQVGIGGIDNVHQEIRERGAICFVDSCPYGDALPEFCVVVSHYTADLICDAINPEYECIWTHHLANGDPYDRYIFRKKSDSHLDINDLGKVVKNIPKFDVPKEAQRELKDYVLLNVLDAVICGFVDAHGPQKALEALLPLSRRIGMEGGNQLAKQNPGVRYDAAAIGHLIDLFGQTIAQRGSVQYLSKDDVRKEVTDCPLQMFTVEMCKVIEALIQGIVYGINPNLEYEYDSMILKGDQTCKWHVRNKGVKPVVIEEVKTEVADPLAMLKMRFARGDISKDEYMEMKAVLES